MLLNLKMIHMYFSFMLFWPIALFQLVGCYDVESVQGHWPLRKSYKIRMNQSSKLSFTKESTVLHIDNSDNFPLNSHVNKTLMELCVEWNMQCQNSKLRNDTCVLQDDDEFQIEINDMNIQPVLKDLNSVLLLQLPYDQSIYASSGSNYYVAHVDVIMPLYSMLKKKYNLKSILKSNREKTKGSNNTTKEMECLCKDGDEPKHEIGFHHYVVLLAVMNRAPSTGVNISTDLFDSIVPHLNMHSSSDSNSNVHYLLESLDIVFHALNSDAYSLLSHSQVISKTETQAQCDERNRTCCHGNRKRGGCICSDSSGDGTCAAPHGMYDYISVLKKLNAVEAVDPRQKNESNATSRSETGCCHEGDKSEKVPVIFSYLPLSSSYVDAWLHFKKDLDKTDTGNGQDMDNVSHMNANESDVTASRAPKPIEFGTKCGFQILFQETDMVLGLPVLPENNIMTFRKFMKRFSYDFRNAALDLYNSNEHESVTTSERKEATDGSVSRCTHPIKTVGLLSRGPKATRRSIINEDELIRDSNSSVGYVSVAERLTAIRCQQHGSKYDDLRCGVEMKLIEFGGGVVRDIGHVNDVHVLVGIQGSGLINGLYLSDSSVTVAIYLNDQWPIITKDPLLLLNYKHGTNKRLPNMYIPYINRNESNIVYDTARQTGGDKYGDGANFVLSEELLITLVLQGLQAHDQYCLAS